MPAVELIRPKGRRSRPRRGDRGKAVLIAGDRRVELPIAPRETSHDGDAPIVVGIDRPGRKPLTRVVGDGLRVLTFGVTLARDGLEVPVETILRAIRGVAADGRPLIYQHGSQLESGQWRISQLVPTITQREAGTNAATRVELAVELTEATDVRFRNGPTRGGHDDGGGGDDKPRSYTWRKGDTPARVSRRFYGRPDLFRLIAKRNGIRHPQRIKTGRKLIIPRRRDDDRRTRAAVTSTDRLAAGDL